MNLSLGTRAHFLQGLTIAQSFTVTGEGSLGKQVLVFEIALEILRIPVSLHMLLSKGKPRDAKQTELGLHAAQLQLLLKEDLDLRPLILHHGAQLLHILLMVAL